MFALNLFDADKWRNLIKDFDAKRLHFVNEVASLINTRGATTQLESARQSLVLRASPIQKQIDGLYSSLKTVRDWLKSVGGIFGLGDLGAFPVIFAAVSLASAVLIVNAVTAWLKDAAKWRADNELAKTIASAGGSAADIARALDKAKEQPELFGFKVGGLKWIAILAGIVIAGPYLVSGLERYQVGRLLK